MFSINFNGEYKVKYARSGLKQTGEPYALVAMIENENQPAGLEHPSKSKATVKAWLSKMPEGVTDGCVIVIESFDGFDWKHIASEAFGKTVYNDVIELKNAKIRLAEAKAEG